MRDYMRLNSLFKQRFTASNYRQKKRKTEKITVVFSAQTLGKGSNLLETEYKAKN